MGAGRCFASRASTDADAAARYCRRRRSTRRAIESRSTPDEYLDDDSVGCTRADDVSGKRYGAVERVEHYPSSDMLVVGGRMFRWCARSLREIDVEKRRIVIDPPAGLLKKHEAR